MTACGCKACGGPQVRADILTARRVVAYAPAILHRRHATAATLANRHQRADLYTRLAMRPPMR